MLPMCTTTTLEHTYHSPLTTHHLVCSIQDTLYPPKSTLYPAYPYSQMPMAKTQTLPARVSPTRFAICIAEVVHPRIHICFSEQLEGFPFPFQCSPLAAFCSLSRSEKRVSTLSKGASIKRTMLVLPMSIFLQNISHRHPLPSTK